MQFKMATKKKIGQDTSTAGLDSCSKLPKRLPPEGGNGWYSIRAAKRKKRKVKTNKLHGLLNWKIFMCWYIFQAKVIFRSRSSGSVIAWACSGFNFHSFISLSAHLWLGHILGIFLRPFPSKISPLGSPLDKSLNFILFWRTRNAPGKEFKGEHWTIRYAIY